METFKKSEKDKGKAVGNNSEDKPTTAVDPPAMTAKEGGTGEDDADESAENEIVQALRHVLWITTKALITIRLY